MNWGVWLGTWGCQTGFTVTTMDIFEIPGVFVQQILGGGGNLGHSILFLVFGMAFPRVLFCPFTIIFLIVYIFSFVFLERLGRLLCLISFLGLFCNIGRGREGSGIGWKGGGFVSFFARHYIPDTSLDSTPQLGTFSLLRMRASSSLEHSVFRCSIYSSYKAERYKAWVMVKFAFTVRGSLANACGEGPMTGTGQRTSPPAVLCSTSIVAGRGRRL